MTTKYLNGSVTGGYTLSAAYTGVVVDSSGTVSGFNPVLGGDGGAALTLPFAASLKNLGRIYGAAGHQAQYTGKFVLPAGTGGAGVVAASGSSLANVLVIDGGEGGAGNGRYGGGAGGTGIYAGSASTITDSGRVEGGQGGAALQTTTLVGRDGGAGGAGVDLAAGRINIDGGSIYGGLAGWGGPSFAVGGAGGAGVVLGAGGIVVMSAGVVFGGVGAQSQGRLGGAGGAGVVLAGGGALRLTTGLIVGGDGGGGSNASGAGGAGVEALAQSTIVADGTVRGGAGGAAGVGSNDDLSQGGAGVLLAAGGILTNSSGGLIVGGYGCYGANANGVGGGGGAGVDLQAGGMVVNAGSIAGGQGSAAYPVNSGGFGVLLAAGGTVKNTGTITGGLIHGETSYSNDGVELRGAGRVINGGPGDSAALIAGQVGLYAHTGGATVINYGTISGAASGVAFTSASDRLVVEAGSKIVAVAHGGGGILELASGTGTITGLGAVGTVTGAAALTFSGFGSYDIDTGSSWSLVGTNTLAAGRKLIDAGTMTLSGTIADAGAVNVSGGKVIVAAAGATLSGSGRVMLSDSAANLITGATAASRLTVGQLLEGAGDVGGGALVLVNQAAGIIRSEGVHALILNTGAATIANAGLIEAIGGGGVTIVSAVANTGRLYALTSTLTVEGAVSGTGVGLVLNGTLKFTAASTFNQNVDFAAGATGGLELAHGQTYKGRISGFSKTGATRLDLDDIAYTAGVTKATYSGTTLWGVLTVTDGTHAARIDLLGDYTSSGWTLSSDGHGGTKIVDPTPAPATASVARLVSAASSFGAKASAPIPSGAPHMSEPSHFLSVVRFARTP